MSVQRQHGVRFGSPTFLDEHESACRAGCFVVAAPWIIDDRLWAVIEPLLPVKAAGTPGPARMNDRLVLQGILFVLVTGSMHTTMLAHCHRAGLIDFDRVIPDGSHVRGKKGRRHRSQPGRPAQSPTS